MRSKTPKYLQDILEMAELITDSTSGKTYDDYVGDIKLRHQIEHEWLIIGEAVVQMYDHDPATADRITDGRRIIGFRNVLAHQYSGIDHEAVWNLIHDRLPGVVSEVEALFAEHPESDLEAAE